MWTKGEWQHNEETGLSTCSKLCGVSNKIYSVSIDTEQYHQWQFGRRYIQDVMPELDSDQREFILSGLTPKEWNDRFGDLEE